MAVTRNNPGNVELGSGKWQGLLPSHLQTSRFAAFEDVVFGIRAIAVTLIAYQDKYRIRTISAAIARYAPPDDDNNTLKYIENVCTWTGFKPNQELNFHDWRHLRPVVLGIMRQESGVDLGGNAYNISPAQVDKALVMAGVKPPVEAERPSRTITGAKVATAATLAAPVAPPLIDVIAPVIEKLVPAAGFFQTLAQAAPWAFAAVALVGLGYIVWARIDDRRRGLR